ncbi:hypothetical protein PQG02_29980 [Nostoc sp. UHCC 0926]|uniref:hypothetical protein n=1 Tax=unclassified Nostoc TaxID=2593658 RepID=UPI00235DD401|nr:hypothetical protein [Nostoc sp. UHCC 0926]WDD32814.1 hypothetical protein PQG02_29980 [Nostoc sp. UHCC 0926]
MLIQDKDLILQEKVKLYNNIAKITDHADKDNEGRLLAEIEIYPTPRIIWDFEILGNVHGTFILALGNSNLTTLLKGYLFSLKQILCTGIAHIGPLSAVRGTAALAVYNDIETLGHGFTFYLSNTRFQYKSNGQDDLLTKITEAETGREVEWRSEGRYIDLPIDDTWSIRLEIRNEALDWLRPENRNTGTLLTTVGQLYQQKANVIESETLSELQAISLNNAFERIKNLCWLLSYINGGYTAPIYIKGEQYTQENPTLTSCGLAAVFSATPLEQLGYSWVTQNSNLTAYIKCFSSFERMIQNSSWKETFEFTLNQYFQATRPRMIWEVIASATGAALERLSYTILIEEETNPTKKADYELLFDITQAQKAKSTWNLGKNSGQENISVTGKRLRLLLERIGLTKCRGCNDIDDVPLFLEVRNDAVHPRVGTMTIEQRWQLIKKAIQWIDEVLLWRLGYTGDYLDRIQGNSTNPRYDLSLRNSSW